MTKKKKGPTPRTPQWKKEGFQSLGSWKAAQSLGTGRPKIKVMLAYAFPNSKIIYHDFADSILTLYEQIPNNILLQRIYIKAGPLMAKARNMIVEKFLESDADYLWMVDSDQVFEPDTLTKLINTDKDIVSALIYGFKTEAHELFIPANVIIDENHMRRLEQKELPEHGLKEVDAVGTGCILIKRRVLEDMGFDHGRYWPFGYAQTEDASVPIGEDITFCLRAREKGFKIYINVDARIGHIKPFII